MAEHADDRVNAEMDEDASDVDIENNEDDGDPQLLAEFQRCLCAEVSSYKADLKKYGTSLSCRLCPYRSFSSQYQLCTHVINYHIEPFFTATAVKSESANKVMTQYYIAEALYHQSALATIFSDTSASDHDFLARSAARLRESNCNVTDEEKSLLQRYNSQYFVLVYTAQGPQLWL